MRRVLCLMVALLFMAVSSDAVPFIGGGEKAYNLGSAPQVGRTYQFDDELGGFKVEGFQEQGEVLTLSFFSGITKLEADDESSGGLSSFCGLATPYDLSPSGFCAYKARSIDKKREYRLTIRWGYEIKKNIRVVVVRVKKTTLKLD